ncbi:MAG: hypothetical protein ACRDT4_17405 [Micromonosporaceae bacterium]
MSIGEAAAELASAASDITGSASRTIRASHDLEEASAAVARLTHGTTAPEPPATTAAWDVAADHTRRAAELLHAGNDAIAAYLKAIGSGAGSPLVEPIKSGNELLEDAEEWSSTWNRGGRRMAEKAKDTSESAGKLMKFHNQLGAQRPSGTTSGTQPPASVQPATKDPYPIDALTTAAVATGIALTLAVDKLVKTIKKYRQPRKDGPR